MKLCVARSRYLIGRLGLFTSFDWPADLYQSCRQGELVKCIETVYLFSTLQPVFCWVLGSVCRKVGGQSEDPSVESKVLLGMK